jgi:hypothetical protein
MTSLFIHYQDKIMTDCWASRQKAARDKRKREGEVAAIPPLLAPCDAVTMDVPRLAPPTTPTPVVAIVPATPSSPPFSVAIVVATPPPRTCTLGIASVATASLPLLPVLPFQPLAGMSWTEKHRPQTMMEVAGNVKAKQQIVKWARAGVWKEPLLLVGPVGVGKTSLAHALCRDMQWRALDCQALPGELMPMVEQVLFRKQPGNLALILDEVDEWNGIERAKLVTLLKSAKRNMLPIVCIAEDVGRNLDTLKRMCTLVRMSRYDMRDAFGVMVRRLRQVTECAWPPRVLQQVERASALDLRRAVIMLELAATGRGAPVIGGDGDVFVDSLFDAAECILAGHPRQLSGVNNTLLFDQHDLMLWMLHENALKRHDLLELSTWMSDMDTLDAHRSHALHDYAGVLSGHLFASLDPPFLRMPPLKFPVGLGVMSQRKSKSNLLAEHRLSYDDWFLLAPVANTELNKQRQDKKESPLFFQHWCSQTGHVVKDFKKVVAEHGTLSYLPGDGAQ